MFCHYNEHISPANFDNYSWCRLYYELIMLLEPCSSISLNVSDANEMVGFFLVVLASFKLGGTLK